MPSTGDVRAEKDKLRAAVGAKLAKLSAAKHSSESERICWVLEGTLKPPSGGVVAVFLPLSDEPDVTPLIAAMLRSGQRLAAPRLQGDGLMLHRFATMEDLEKGSYGNLEPSADTVIVAASDVFAVLVPGRAFDRSGRRLGRGGGHYDRFLKEFREANRKAAVWGVCFRCQLVRKVPTADHDEGVDGVVSPEEVLSPKR